MEKQLNIDKSDWLPVKFGDVVEERREAVSNPEAVGLQRIVGLEHIESENIHISSWGNISDGTTFTRRFRKGQVLFGRCRAYLKKAALVDFNGVCSGDIIVMQSKDSLLSELMPFLISSENFFDYAIKNSAGSLSSRVKFKDLAEYEILLPLKQQQARLAELLWAGDEMVEKTRSCLKRLEKQLAVTENKLFFKYSDKKLKSIIINTLSGGTPDTKKSEYYLNGTIPWITTKILEKDFINTGEKYITEEAVENSAAKILPKNNIIAGTRVGVGKFAVNEQNISFSQDINGIVIDHKKIDIEFLVYQLNSKVFRKKTESLLRGTTIKGILKDDLLNLNIFIPKNKEQIKSRNEIRSIKLAIKNIKSKVYNSKALNKSLINQIF